LFFALIFSLSKKILAVENAAEQAVLLTILIELFGSILAGAAIGWILGLYLKKKIPYVSVFIFGLIFFVSKFAPLIHLNILLIFIVAGFLVENLTPLGDALLSVVDRSSLIIYVLFFGVAGASLNLAALKQTWFLALVIVSIRLLAIWASTYWGSVLARTTESVKKYSWMGFVSQAGVGLGLAIMIERTFPGWGSEFKTLILAVIAINQIIGPILFKYALIQSGDARVL
jgi:Kef-type K+ transport system membrane component KefB